MLWDSGSTLSFITFEYAKKLKLQGKPIRLEIASIGGITKYINSMQYSLYIKDERGIKVPIDVLGIDVISKSRINAVIQDINKFFPWIDKNRIRYPWKGNIESLIGFDYAAHHPTCIDSIGHVVLLENRFGYTVAGSHGPLKGRFDSKGIVKHATVLHSNGNLDAFYSVENLGINCVPRCGACKCGECHAGGKNMSLKEEQEYILIESKITFQEKKGRYIASYPWIKNPGELPDNRSLVYAMLVSIEKRLMKNSNYAMLYRRQVDDMIERKVARKLEEKELLEYKKAKFYISHFAVMKPDSKTTPCRIVFNSSKKYLGHSLNDYLAKGPSLLKQLLGILLRFRLGRVGFIGDISKMFHSVDIPVEDQMTHLFLWRDMVTNKCPDTYAITVVNFGDRPSSTIAQIALKKTAVKGKEISKKASEIILNNSYMDDISGSVDTIEEAETVTRDMSQILLDGGFRIKEWFISRSNNKNVTPDDQKIVQKILNTEPGTETEKVLGLSWNTQNDMLFFMPKSNISKINEEKINKRCILARINSIFDPLGLLSPVTVKAKILLRRIWGLEPKVDWDDTLPTEIKESWHKLFNEISGIYDLTFDRAITPDGAMNNAPTLIIFSDGSREAYGAVAYCRWEMESGFSSLFIIAKNRIAPLKMIDIVRLELCGALLSVRIRSYIEKEMGLQFRKVYHLVDSQIVKAMVDKASYGFNTFTGNRIGEIHQMSSAEEWYWISGKDNVADMITRGCEPSKLGVGSIWQNGPKFLALPEDQWPINKETDVKEIPERRRCEFTGMAYSKEEGFVGPMDSEDTLIKRIDINRFSKLKLLIHTTARILKLYKRFKKNGVNEAKIKPEDIHDAEILWIKEAQASMQQEVMKGKYIKLQPKISDGVIVVGGRTERWMEATWNRQNFILLPNEHKLSRLIAVDEHFKGGHLGCAATVSRIRSKYWIVGVRKVVNTIINNCVQCKIKFKRVSEQIMSPLPLERIKPSPPFLNVGIDYFGPYAIRGEVQKRTRGKGYGVLITCLSCRAVHVDIAHDYSTNGFMQVYRRFIALRGSPQKIYSDQGTCLIGASNELKDIVKNVDWVEVQSYGLKEGTTWTFSPASAPWYNGATEALVKSVKRALNAMIGENVMTFSEMQTAFMEAGQLVNQRPIGRHPSHPDEGSYLCPNDLILGRASTHVPQGPFKDRSNVKFRLDFVERLVQCFWKRWIREVFPSLVVSPKWHTERRNLHKGDVVLIEDANAIRGIWKMGIITEAIMSQDGKVRRAKVAYKNNGELVVERPVQKLIVLVPVDQ